jgi:hypothetical protein
LSLAVVCFVDIFFVKNQGGGFMRKLTMTLAAAAFALGTMAVSAHAQAQYSGATAFHAQIRNATPIEKAACRGFGPYCPPGYVRACGPYRCWCRPCF